MAVFEFENLEVDLFTRRQFRATRFQIRMRKRHEQTHAAVIDDVSVSQNFFNDAAQARVGFHRFFNILPRDATIRFFVRKPHHAVVLAFDNDHRDGFTGRRRIVAELAQRATAVLLLTDVEKQIAFVFIDDAGFDDAAFDQFRFGVVRFLERFDDLLHGLKFLFVQIKGGGSVHSHSVQLKKSGGWILKRDFGVAGERGG